MKATGNSVDSDGLLGITLKTTGRDCTRRIRAIREESMEFVIFFCLGCTNGMLRSLCAE